MIKRSVNLICFEILFFNRKGDNTKYISSGEFVMERRQ